MGPISNRTIPAWVFEFQACDTQRDEPNYHNSLLGLRDGTFEAMVKWPADDKKPFHRYANHKPCRIKEENIDEDFVRPAHPNVILKNATI